MSRLKEISINKNSGTVSTWFSDVLELAKFKLNFFVVFSAVMAALIASGGSLSLGFILILSLGGFLTTAAANTLNQLLEIETDALMNRTKNRPLVTGSMSKESALILAGLFGIAGISLLGSLNHIAALMGAISLFGYAFVYTPLKKRSKASVYIGGIPGALPVVIGCAAVEGGVTALAIVLFAIQFLWQLPHFWAIAWLANEDYSKAGFQLLPSSSNEKDENVGYASLVASIILGIVSLMIFAIEDYGVIVFGLIVLVNVMYLSYSYKLFRENDDRSAKQLMFSSFIYLPVILIAIFLGSL